MPRKSPFSIILTKDEQRELDRRAAKYTLPYFIVAHAKMILLAAQGFNNDQIAAKLSTPRKVVSMWRKRFYQERIPGLEERPRPGRPPVSPPRTRRSK
jgi:hypothetical protein